MKLNARDLPEVQALYKRYTPEWQTSWHQGGTHYVEYGLSKSWNITPNATIAEPTEIHKMLGLSVVVDPFTGTKVWMICNGGISSETHYKPVGDLSKPATAQMIRSTDCLENPRKIPPEFLKH